MTMPEARTVFCRTCQQEVHYFEERLKGPLSCPGCGIRLVDWLVKLTTHNPATGTTIDQDIAAEQSNRAAEQQSSRATSISGC
jgi:hypothetical protein